MTFQLLPAVDIRNGQAVRLVQGESGTETSYGDPIAAALDFQAAGAKWLHLVDLDAAFGTGNNLRLLAQVVAAVDISVEVSGGIRDDASLEQALAAGAARVNLGTAALEDAAWTASVIARFGEQIAVGLDVRGETLAARGWTKEVGNLWQVLAQLDAARCRRYVVTDVTKDGTMKGPNTQLLQAVMARTGAPVIASGGVATLSDIAILRDSGAEGAIVGKALYAGAFTLAAALEVAGKQ